MGPIRESTTADLAFVSRTIADAFVDVDFATALDGDVERLGSLGETMAAHHPDGPHRYLLAIGVRPARQGRGLGADLLDDTLGQADACGEASYLEATSPRSHVLYERHGYEVTGELAVADGPTIWPMWRSAR